ncbi:hypothetical protein [Vibrio campbellii]|uniref:hypothetical protein n=1 Tax=Vibrio campbellii TaxID=680 RepID=UPI00210874CD|nr:hypothetical protein [Vibrio campbellii]UTZ44516.1 hypothetical protein HB764_24975 [Vibrio campbellii]
MTKEERREKHSKFQRDVKLLDNYKKLKAVDVMLVRQISGGMTDANQIAGVMRTTKEKLLSSITEGVFKIIGDSINIA